VASEQEGERGSRKAGTTRTRTGLPVSNQIAPAARNLARVWLKLGVVAETSAPAAKFRPTVLASGLLAGLLAIVVICTRADAFHSPLAVMVVAAIGLAAVLLQLRFYNRQQLHPVHAPLWLNVLGILLALIALFSDLLGLSRSLGQMAALGAVGAFAISSAIILHGFRKHRILVK
jgi:ABC-type uncharacterized transport system permease subunit